jgi:hypothetical protein
MASCNSMWPASSRLGRQETASLMDSSGLVLGQKTSSSQHEIIATRRCGC